MSRNVEGWYRGRDMGVVEVAGDPAEQYSVSWLNFGGVVLDAAKVETEAPVPVSTKDLVDAGVDLTPRENGDPIFVWADVTMEGPNDSPIDVSDVQPSNFEPVPDMTDEEKAEFDHGRY